MKTNKKYVHMAIVSTVLSLTSMRKFAEEMVDAISNDHSGSVELNDTKGNGFILRRKKDAHITDSYLVKKIRAVTEKMMSDNYEDAVEHISENYDFVYKESQIDDDMVTEIFDISRNGRLIYIEVDISE